MQTLLYICRICKRNLSIFSTQYYCHDKNQTVCVVCKKIVCNQCNQSRSKILQQIRCKKCFKSCQSSENLFYQHNCDSYFCSHCITDFQVRKQTYMFPCGHNVPKQDVVNFMSNFCIKCGGKIDQEKSHQQKKQPRLCHQCVQCIKCLICQKQIKKHQAKVDSQSGMTFCEICFNLAYKEQQRYAKKPRKQTVKLNYSTRQQINTPKNQLKTQVIKQEACLNTNYPQKTLSKGQQPKFNYYNYESPNTNEEQYQIIKPESKQDKKKQISKKQNKQINDQVQIQQQQLKKKLNQRIVRQNRRFDQHNIFINKKQSNKLSKEKGNVFNETNQLMATKSNNTRTNVDQVINNFYLKKQQIPKSRQTKQLNRKYQQKPILEAQNTVKVDQKFEKKSIPAIQQRYTKEQKQQNAKKFNEMNGQVKQYQNKKLLFTKQYKQLPIQQKQESANTQLPYLENKMNLISDSLRCPILQEIMVSPMMITICGHTFQEKAIRQWFLTKKNCPVCKKLVTSLKTQLIKNYALATVISKIKY